MTGSGTTFKRCNDVLSRVIRARREGRPVNYEKEFNDIIYAIEEMVGNIGPQKVKKFRDEQTDESDLAIYVPSRGFNDDSMLYRFSGIKVRIIRERVHDIASGELHCTEWTVAAQFRQYPDKTLFENKVEIEVFQATEADAQWNKELSVMEKRKGVRVIRFRKREEEK